ncbi:MAG: transcriptional repressor LexA [Gammaproteobacteria bacterium]|nr:transcriptional repressor LexA [Gammaproteobacteria bacterium]
MKLTRRQQEIYDYLHINAESFKHPPTYDELCQELGLSSRGSLHKHIQALVNAGLIEPMAGRQGIRLVEQEQLDEGIPHLGTIAAGQPIEAIPQPEYLSVPGFLLSQQPCYALTIKGESMINIGIMDGDMVIIEKRDTAHNGEVVVALINNEEATLKRQQNNNDGSVTLVPENSEMEPMTYPAEQVQIQGVLVSLLRRY